MNDPETAVHQTIIDLYELQEYAQVKATDIAQQAGLPLAEVEASMQLLEAQEIIACDAGGVVTMAKNCGYNPWPEEDGQQ